MNCKNCGANISDSSNVCKYCGSSVTDKSGADIIFKIKKYYFLQNRGFIVEGEPLREIAKDDVVTNSRTGQSYIVYYVASPKGKLLKKASVNEVCLLNLLNARNEDFNPNDVLVK